MSFEGGGWRRRNWGQTGTLRYEVEILGYQAGIWALGLEFRLPGWDLGLGIGYWAWH